MTGLPSVERRVDSAGFAVTVMTCDEVFESERTFDTLRTPLASVTPWGDPTSSALGGDVQSDGAVFSAAYFHSAKSEGRDIRIAGGDLHWDVSTSINLGGHVNGDVCGGLNVPGAHYRRCVRTLQRQVFTGGLSGRLAEQGRGGYTRSREKKGNCGRTSCDTAINTKALHRATLWVSYQYQADVSVAIVNIALVRPGQRMKIVKDFLGLSFPTWAGAPGAQSGLRARLWPHGNLFS